eukprot:10686597-Alexandrium_andersonii.AAC.1
MASMVVLAGAALRGMPACRPAPPLWWRGYPFCATRWQHLWNLAPDLVGSGRHTGHGTQG